MPGRPPPGRAGRVWLVERLEVARRAVDLLEQKQRLLRREHRRFAELVERTRRQWEMAAADAEVWNRRADLTGGRDERRRAAATTGDADVRLGWRSEMGVTYPATSAVELPPARALAGPAALARAAEACRVGVDAAVRHAAATCAFERVDAELAATTRRLRAVRDRWLPGLETRLDRLDLQLDETEREEMTSLRRLAGRARPPTEVPG